MKTLNYIIVKVESEYENDRSGIVENIDNNNTFFITREAEVLAAPDFTILKKGDKVICHHNIFRKKGSVSGMTIHSAFHIEDNIYHVPLTEVFMYKRDNGWESLSPFCFVKPIPYIKSAEELLELSEDELMFETHKGMIRNTGVLVYPCKELEHLKNKKIIFSYDSEYEFYIDGEIYYKMNINDILMTTE